MIVNIIVYPWYGYGMHNDAVITVGSVYQVWRTLRLFDQTNRAVRVCFVRVAVILTVDK